MNVQTNARMLIGQFVAITGHNMHTIRWYEAQGLLPRVPRDGGGRRVYSQRHLSWMKLIDRLRSSGMSIAQLSDFTRLAQQGSTTLEPTRSCLQAHREVVVEKIAEWQNALTLIDQKIDFYNRWIKTGHQPKKER
jgi:DNA-binding transcriptional MerR regulator